MRSRELGLRQRQGTDASRHCAVARPVNTRNPPAAAAALPMLGVGAATNCEAKRKRDNLYTYLHRGLLGCSVVVIGLGGDQVLLLPSFKTSGQSMQGARSDGSSHLYFHRHRVG
jgi:hypothetical protein